MKWKINRWFLFIVVFTCSHSLNAQSLDQSQLIYNGGMSARTLAGYSEWQSFTAGMSGMLSQIRMGFFNYISGNATLKVFSGSGTAGTLLQTKPVTVYCASGNCMIQFNVSVLVTAGQVYTFQFIPGAGIPDPYGVQVQVPGTYSGGQMAIVDPSGTYPLTFDMVFQTYVGTSPLPVELISFAGINENNINHIYWSTATETNSDYFDVEKSIDGIEFEKVGTVVGNGNSNHVINYTFDDKNIIDEINYYRLKQVDYNGEYNYSNIIDIKNEARKNSFWINQTEENGIYILHCIEWKNAVIRVFDTKGNQTGGIYPINSNTEIKIDLNNCIGGLYLVKIINRDQNICIKVIK